MATYVGIYTQQSRNNLRSMMLLLMFPLLVLSLVYLFFAFTSQHEVDPWRVALEMTISSLPMVLGVVAVWFLIAYFFNTAIIRSATNATTLDRRDNKRIYNLVENLCMASGMDMPQINIIEDRALNAFASGIDKKSYTVTLTRGIIERLDDKELEGVIAHELTHIRNRDVRLLIVSIVFVGIFTLVAQMAIRSAFYGSMGRSNDREKSNNAMVAMLLVAVLSFVGYLFATMLQLAISRKREYMADAGAADMTKDPLALASALEKISTNPNISNVQREDVAQLFIEHRTKKSLLSTLFATHPPIEERIKILRQF